jgi:hypothetical protein
MGVDRVRSIVQSPESAHEIPLYSLVHQRPEIPGEMEPVVASYLAARAQVKRAVTPADKARFKRIYARERRTLRNVFSEQQNERLVSVLKRSQMGGAAFDNGKESQVYDHDSARFVYKYSRGERTPLEIEYLQKKNALLKKLMGKHIPRSVVVYGEYTRERFNYEDPREPARTRKGAITMQRRVHGKSFARMTPEERKDPETQAALLEALRAYNKMRWVVSDACLSCGKQATVLPVRLDVGYSSSSNPNSMLPADLERFDSPNLMYDTETKTAYFVDFGFGTWSADAELVYQRIMAEPEPTAPFSSSSV